MSKRINMVVRVGESLYGKSWKSEISHHLKIAVSTFSQWLNGSRHIPVSKMFELEDLIVKKQVELDAALILLKECRSEFLTIDLQELGIRLDQDEYLHWLFSISTEQLKAYLDAITWALDMDDQISQETYHLDSSEIKILDLGLQFVNMFKTAYKSKFHKPLARNYLSEKSKVQSSLQFDQIKNRVINIHDRYMAYKKGEK